MKRKHKKIILLCVCSAIFLGSLQTPQTAYGEEVGNSNDENLTIEIARDEVDFQLHLGSTSNVEEQEDFWTVIDSTEEMQTFIDGALTAYCDKMRFVNEQQQEKLLQHLQTLDEAFFQKNIYVITVNGHFTYMASLYVEGLTDVGESQEDSLFGKVLHLNYGYGMGEQQVPGVVVGGTVIPRADLDGKDIVDVQVSTDRNEDAIETWYGNLQVEETIYQGVFGERCMAIVGYRNVDANTNLEIPAYIGEFQVKVIGEGAFEGAVADRIVLPDTVREIQARAFANSRINEIQLQYQLKTIGDYAFYGIEGMDSITLPRRMKTIGAEAFASEDGKQMTICGYTDSLAESYATEHGYSFVPIGKEFGATTQISGLHYAGDVGNLYTDTYKSGLSAEDALKILQYVVSLREEIDTRAADANQDGTIDATDALHVLECVVELKEAQVLRPHKYELYQSCLGNLKNNWGEEEPEDALPDDLWTVIESKEELEEFISGDLEKYFEKLTRKWGNIPSAPVHVQYLDDAFFEENVYVVNILGFSGMLADYQLDCLENVMDEEKDALVGKRLRICWGSFDEYAEYPDMAIEAVYGGFVIPRSDLDGVDIVDVVVD